MDLNELYLDLTLALASDPEISSWCMAEYSQAHKIFMNFDIGNPPGEEDCPFFAIYPDFKRVGQLVGKKGHVFEVVSCLYDDNSKLHEQGNIIEYTGVRKLETFRKKAEDALVAVDIGNAVFDVIDIDYDTISEFPFLMCGMAVSIREEILIGQNPFT